MWGRCLWCPGTFSVSLGQRVQSTVTRLFLQLVCVALKDLFVVVGEVGKLKEHDVDCPF